MRNLVQPTPKLLSKTSHCQQRPSLQQSALVELPGYSWWSQQSQPPRRLWCLPWESDVLQFAWIVTLQSANCSPRTYWTSYRYSGQCWSCLKGLQAPFSKLAGGVKPYLDCWRWYCGTASKHQPKTEHISGLVSVPLASYSIWSFWELLLKVCRYRTKIRRSVSAKDTWKHGRGKGQVSGF
jgi:hypothetical protein